MSSMSTSTPVVDIESQQEVLIIACSNTPRDLWRWFILILRARRVLKSTAVKAKSTYGGVINNGGEQDHANVKVVHVLPTSSQLNSNMNSTSTWGRILNSTAVKTKSTYGVINNNANEDNANVEITEVVQVLPTSPDQLSVVVSCDGDSSTVSDIKLQQANIERMVKAKDIGYMRIFGGVRGIAEALGTDLDKGITGHEEDLYCRRKIINTNPITQAPAQGFFQLLLKSCNNYIILLLFVSALMSTGFGIKEEGLRTGWYEGAIIILGGIILVVVPSIRDFWRENSKKLPEEQKRSEKKQMVVGVLRGGNLKEIRVSDVVIGDIVHLRRGSKVPGDGLLISGESLKLDDGLATINEENPFLYHSAKVVSGHGRMLVTSVGKNTVWNEIMSRVTEDPCKTPLPAQIDKVSFATQIVGLSISILLPIVVFLHYKLGKQKHDTGVPDMKGKPLLMKDLMDAIKRIFMKPSEKVSLLTTSLTMMVVGIVEGVPFIVSLGILYWNKKALSNNDFAQNSLACVSMGSVTTICTDKIGGMTMNQQEVSMCWIGQEAITEDSAIDTNVLEALCHGISTNFLMHQSPSNSTEDPILSWATLSLGMEMEHAKQSCTIVDPKEIISSEDGSRALVRKKKDRESHECLHWKGPAEKLLAKCSLYYDTDGTEKNMDKKKRFAFEQIIKRMHSKDLQTLAFAYKKVDGPAFEDNRLILIGMLGLKYTKQTETRKAIEACRNAGVNVILISDGNLSLLKDAGTECGLPCNSGRLVVDGEEFRRCSDEERMKMLENIGYIGNCLPDDKLTLVRCLKQKGQVVAMVGFGTNETPALKEANVGIAMGTWSSELARESSDVIILDGNFSSLVPILLCGRCIYNNIQKYIQLEVTMVIAGLLITAITTIAFGDSPITAIQWFWANLVVGVLAGLALLTEQPSEKLMEKPPIRQTDSFITKAMWRNIITQALFQAVVLVTFQFKSKSVLRISNKDSETMIFNSLVLCQVFNQFNAREPQMKNVFKGIHRNMWLWVSVSVTVVLQVVFIEIAHILAGNARLNGEQWGICFLIGILSLAVDFAAKCTSIFIMSFVRAPHCSEIGSVGMTHSESTSNLEIPLINLDSSANP